MSEVFDNREEWEKGPKDSRDVPSMDLVEMMSPEEFMRRYPRELKVGETFYIAPPVAPDLTIAFPNIQEYPELSDDL